MAIGTQFTFGVGERGAPAEKVAIRRASRSSATSAACNREGGGWRARDRVEKRFPGDVNDSAAKRHGIAVEDEAWFVCLFAHAEPIISVFPQCETGIAMSFQTERSPGAQRARIRPAPKGRLAGVS